jgi:hypothetical protein
MQGKIYKNINLQIHTTSYNSWSDKFSLVKNKKFHPYIQRIAEEQNLD